ncbi:hypothetical protein CMQ_2860 [Grosmannia clavigera kw1407]|uniref:Uncharacterized protein n=1 Tax=Grosmannia clavigera (strain kw1407 / UAMH 11150) TaxID=655863 RepID=F0XGK2_GROCL|nr:uncharacterized protein CMQ_2860 [Grosmannia clavigera kw1407]EFX02931.1 hypothetical protein CMQ_2860 [Grosmannia clavigera kw1407]
MASHPPTEVNPELSLFPSDLSNQSAITTRNSTGYPQHQRTESMDDFVLVDCVPSTGPDDQSDTEANLNWKDPRGNTIKIVDPGSSDSQPSQSPYAGLSPTEDRYQSLRKTCECMKGAFDCMDPYALENIRNDTQKIMHLQQLVIRLSHEAAFNEDERRQHLDVLKTYFKSTSSERRLFAEVKNLRDEVGRLELLLDKRAEELEMHLGEAEYWKKRAMGPM